MRLLYALVANLLLLVLLPLRLLRRARAAPRGAWLSLDVEGTVVEIGRPVPFWVRRERPLALQQLREALQEAAGDPRVVGLVVTLDGVGAGSAIAASLRQALGDFRAAGKRLVAYLPHGGRTKELYVASVAEAIWIGPDALAEPLGFAIQMPYVGPGLSRAGVQPDVLARGQYKTAGESLISAEMSDAQKEQVGAFLDALYADLVEGFASGRGVSTEQAERWIEQGPWVAKDAVTEGLCDAEVHPDEVPGRLVDGDPSAARIVPLMSYARRRRIRFVRMWPERYLAVIPVQGPIVSKAPTPFIPMAVEQDFVSAVRRVWEDPRALGAVIVVNSQGGGAVASERMRRALSRLSAKKPTVAYLANVAASGGYMIAVGAQAIVAQPTTLTGSIGVVAARMVVGDLLEKLGIHVQVVKRGSRADFMSPSRRLEDGEREALDRYLDAVYHSFVSAVAEGRGKSFEQIDAVARGRIWSGKDAKQRGLVDELGNFELALTALRKRIGAGAERARPKVVASPKLRAPRLLAQVPGAGGALVALSLFEGDRAWAWCGFSPESDDVI